MGLTHRILWCRTCVTGYASVGELPALCPNCGQPANWSDTLEPRVRYELTFNDKRFLRSINVQWREEP